MSELIHNKDGGLMERYYYHFVQVLQKNLFKNMNKNEIINQNWTLNKYLGDVMKCL